MRRAALLVLLALTGCTAPPTSAELSSSASSASSSRLATMTTGAGPAATATPLAVLVQRPTGGTCAADKTLVPNRVIYTDGSVLDTDEQGFFCEPVPHVTAAWIDGAWLRVRLDTYFRSEAGIDLTTSSVADGERTTLTYLATDGTHRAVADVLNSDEADFSSEQQHGREALRALLAEINAHVTDVTRWTPRQLEVVKPADFAVPTTSAVAAWPIPVSPAVAAVLRGPPGGCTVVTGADVPAILAANLGRQTVNRWRIGGSVSGLALGVVLPGQPTCHNDR